MNNNKPTEVGEEAEVEARIGNSVLLNKNTKLTKTQTIASFM